MLRRFGGPAVTLVDGVAQLVGSTSGGGQYCGVTPDIYTGEPDFRTWIYDTARGAPAA